MVGAANSSAATDAVLVRFGNAGFHEKFQVLLNNMAQWEAAAGRVASVDLRFEKEVVVNPETSSSSSAPSWPVAAKPVAVAKAVAPEHHREYKIGGGHKAKTETCRAAAGHTCAAAAAIMRNRIGLRNDARRFRN